VLQWCSEQIANPDTEGNPRYRAVDIPPPEIEGDEYNTVKPFTAVTNTHTITALSVVRSLAVFGSGTVTALFALSTIYNLHATIYTLQSTITSSKELCALLLTQHFTSIECSRHCTASQQELT
jgi:hypothetical protein